MNEENLFRSMENEYLDVSNQVKTLISQVKGERGADRDKTFQRIQRAQTKADDLIKQMNMEANSIAKLDIKERCKQRLKTYTGDLNDLKKQIKDAKDTVININSGRDYLLGSNTGDATNSLMTSDDYRKRMENNSRTLQNSGAVIDQTNSLLAETEETAIDAAQRVRDQGEQIKRQRERVRDIHTEIQVGGRTINSMNRTRITNSIIMIVVILVLLGIIGVILYFVIKPIIDKFRPSKK